MNHIRQIRNLGGGRGELAYAVAHRSEYGSDGVGPVLGVGLAGAVENANGLSFGEQLLNHLSLTVQRGKVGAARNGSFIKKCHTRHAP